MLAIMRNIWRMILAKNLASIIASIPRISADEQTISSWAKPIKSYEAVPDIYKDFFEPYLANGRAFPYSVLTPSYEGFLHRTTEKLISDFGAEITVLERKGNTFEALCYPLKGISYVEVRTVLLDSHFKICGVTRHGVPASSILRFNSVTDYLFMPILETIRSANHHSKETIQSAEFEKFDRWVRSNYKFMNYAKRSLRGGEKVIHTILQPEIRTKLLTILGKTYYKTISPTHVCILTDGELILIREEVRQSGDDRYGGIWDYIPLNKIVNLSLSEKDKDLLLLSVHLAENTRLECLFQASAKGEIDQLLERFGELSEGKLIEAV